jgi:hypothetical protein
MKEYGEFTITKKRYKKYGNYCKMLVRDVLNTFQIKPEYVQGIDFESDYGSRIFIYLPNSEMIIRMWDIVSMGEVTSTRYSVFEEELKF